MVSFLRRVRYLSVSFSWLRTARSTRLRTWTRFSPTSLAASVGTSTSHNAAKSGSPATSRSTYSRMSSAPGMGTWILPLAGLSVR